MIALSGGEVSGFKGESSSRERLVITLVPEE